MRTYMIYLLLTGKRLLRQLPCFLAGLAVMVLLVGMAAFSASKVLYGETSLKKIEVGVVLPEDDALSEKITKMIASLDSVESLCDFSYLEHDEPRGTFPEENGQRCRECIDGGLLWNFGDCISDDSYRNPGSAVSGSPDGGAGTGASAHRDPAVVSAFLQMLVHDASSDGSHGGRLWLGGAEGICAGGAGRTGGVGADLRGSFGVDSAVL